MNIKLYIKNIIKLYNNKFLSINKYNYYESILRKFIITYHFILLFASLSTKERILIIIIMVCNYIFY